jgi:Uma2 family endonuclease
MSLDLEPVPSCDTVSEEPETAIQEERKGCELVDGIWVEKAMGNPAAIVGSNILGHIHEFVRPRKLGHVLGAEGAYRMLPDRPKLLRKPDVSFVAAGRLSPEELKKAEWAIAPDLAVEGISPNESAEDLETKLDEYLRAGVRLVWLVYIPTQNVWAYRPDGTAKRYRADDSLTGDDVLPGFAVKVSELFEGL